MPNVLAVFPAWEDFAEVNLTPQFQVVVIEVSASTKVER